MNIRPLADRVLIKPAAAEEKTLGGIIIPDSAKEKPLNLLLLMSLKRRISSFAHIPAAQSPL